jgi:lipopolysaccharide export system permease protein
MTIFSRYVFRQAAGALLLILLSLTGVVWIALALKQLNLVTTQGQDTWVFLIMTTLALPNLLALIAPVALLIAAIHVLNRLNSDSELIVLTASGATTWTIARPLILLALLVALGVTAVNHWVMPWSLRQLREYIVQVRTDLLSQVLQPGRFTSPEPNLTFHIRDRALNGELLGILMHDAREKNQSVSYLADRGAIVKQEGTTFLVMSQGQIIRKADLKEVPQIVTFDTYAVDLERFEPKSATIGLQPRERYFSELAYPDPGDILYRRQAGQFRAELHERFSNPLYPLAFVMIAVAFVGQARSTRQNRIEAVVIAFLAAALARLAGLAVNNLAVLRTSMVPVLYLIPVVSIVLSVLAVHINARPRRGPGPTDRLLMLADRLSAALGPFPLRRRSRLSAGE